jgi:hypothetical protein
MVLEEELSNFQMEGRLNLKVMVKDPPKGWPFLYGDLTKDLIINELPLLEKVVIPANIIESTASDNKQDLADPKSSQSKMFHL